MADEQPPPNLDGLVDKFIEELFDPAKLTRPRGACYRYTTA